MSPENIRLRRIAKSIFTVKNGVHQNAYMFPQVHTLIHLDLPAVNYLPIQYPQCQIAGLGASTHMLSSEGQKIDLKIKPEAAETRASVPIRQSIVQSEEAEDPCRTGEQRDKATQISGG